MCFFLKDMETKDHNREVEIHVRKTGRTLIEIPIQEIHKIPETKI